MELPETCLTNVFKIDNLSEISYSVYRISSTFGSAPAWRVLSKAETNLRRRGKCVTTCSESSELWLFQIDNHDSDIAFTSDSGYNSYDGSGASEKGWEPMVWGLEEKTKEVLNVHEIFEALRPTPSEKLEDLFQLQTLSQIDPLVSPGTQLDPIDLSGTHRDVYMLQQLSKQRGSGLSISAVGSPVSGSRHGSSTTGTPHTTATRQISKQELVGQKLLLAIMSLLSYRLASSFSWLPLNLCTFLPKLDNEPAEEPEILSYSPVSHGPPLITTISLGLSEDGSLQISPKTISQSALRRLSSTDLSDTTELDVWLAPGGVLGRHMPKSGGDGLSQATPEWKAFILKSLSDRGIDIDQLALTEWAKIGVWSEIEGLIEVFWPTGLIFVRKYGGTGVYPSSTASPIGPGDLKLSTNADGMNDLVSQLTWYNAGDSLEFAEIWLSGSGSRDAEKRRRLEARNKTIPTMDIDRKPPLAAPTTDRSGTVYPTPPDGLSGNDSHPTPGGPTTAPTPGQAKPTEEPIPVVEPPTAPPTAEAIVNGADMDLDDNWLKGDASKVNDDIFGGQGGMGDDLFDIDITEDDFGFFDKIGGDDDFVDMGLEKPQISTDLQARPATSHLSENMNELNLGFTNIGSYANDKLLDDMDLDVDDIGAAMDMQAEMQKDIIISTQAGSEQSLSQPNGQGHKSVRMETQSDDTQHTVVQVETPPLSPQRAMKLLLLDPQSPRPPPPLSKGRLVLPLSRRKSLYSPVDFPSFMERSDEKYMAGGRFFCAEDDSSPRKNSSSEDRRFSATFPRVKKYRNSRRPLSRDIMFLEDDEDRSDLIPDTGSSDEESSSTDEYESGDEEMFEVSNEGAQDNSSYSASPEGIRQGLKRKRIPSERDYWGGGNKAHGVEALNHSDKLDGEPEWAADMAHLNDKDIDNLSLAQRTLCDFSSTDISLDGVFKFLPDNDDISNRLSSQDFSHVVGLLQEQVVWNTYLISTFYPGSPSFGRVSSIESDSNGINDQAEQSLRLRKQSTRHQDDMEDLLTDLFGALTTRCSLETLVYGAIGRPKNSIYGVSPGLMDPHSLSTGLTPINRPKSSSDANNGSSQLFKISAPHVHVHRNATLPNSAIELLPPALHFWDTFGLTPHSGPKDLLMAAVFPTEAGLATASRVYLEAFSSTYENCRLGEILPVKTSQILDGLHGIALQIQGKTQSLDEKTMLRRYCDGIIKLGETLVEIDDELQNVVLFIVNPFDTPSSVLEICIAFHALKKAYVNALNSSLRVFPNNIILQIVPVKNMAVQDGLAVQSHNQSIRCALEVYERCTLTIQDHLSQTFPQETYSPSVTLAKLPPKSIAFRVSSDPSPAILQENMCLHMAYAQSIDERWISVAWGDDCGDIKEVGNFCLGIPGTVVLRGFEDICREIWAVTNKIISKKRVHWRISLVKVGAIDDDEVEFWMKLSHDCAVPNTLTVFSSDPSPPLTFKCAIPSIMPQAFNGQAQLVGTPGATPQSSGVSPDQFGASSSQGGALTPGDTPAPEVDNDMALVDFTDETWGALLQHPLNNSDSAIVTRPALASGYLIKRSGPNETDEPAVLAVSLIRVGQRGLGMPTATAQQHQTPAISRSNEDMLREILTQYRGLVTLAQHFGVTDIMKEVLPWHIAAVVKCRDAFSCVL
ncbi:mediator of RNA polymerase II transcription subunit 13 [Arthrobotrys musiformis]|uniref:Mediator of RNA polymerase II transcription subunit 13 n=1 Tax=Arthrobotrys musiformis TaxID=47236 RepID=A0AAV9W6J9_9PEZI